MKIKIIIAVSLVAVALTVWVATNLLGCGLLTTTTEQGFASDRTFQSSTVDSFAFGGTAASSSSGLKAQATTIDVNTVADQLALAQNGAVSHALYLKIGTTERSLNYATNASGSWIISALDSYPADINLGVNPSITIDTAGHPHIAYIGTYFNTSYNYTMYALKYGTNASGSWETAVILPPYRSLNSMGEELYIHNEYQPIILVDSNDKAHIIYMLSSREAIT